MRRFRAWLADLFTCHACMAQASEITFLRQQVSTLQHQVMALSDLRAASAAATLDKGQPRHTVLRNGKNGDRVTLPPMAQGMHEHYATTDWREMQALRQARAIAPKDGE